MPQPRPHQFSTFLDDGRNAGGDRHNGDPNNKG
jgi:hypothetical protein